MNPVTGLSLGRIAIGAVALAAPPLATGSARRNLVVAGIAVGISGLRG